VRSEDETLRANSANHGALGPGTALIPILNVSLAAKAILTGGVPPLPLLEVYLSLAAVAALCLCLCVRAFRNEETLFRL
jgi:ABC-type Na+ efflux pump permease subunit